MTGRWLRQGLAAGGAAHVRCLKDRRRGVVVVLLAGLAVFWWCWAGVGGVGCAWWRCRATFESGEWSCCWRAGRSVGAWCPVGCCGAECGAGSGGAA
jgi:hypothetical protein